MFHALLQILQFHHHHRPCQRFAPENFHQRSSPKDTAEEATRQVNTNCTSRKTMGVDNFVTLTLTWIYIITLLGISTMTNI